jgi:LemA protein
MTSTGWMILLAGAGGYVVYTYNRLVLRRNKVRTAFSTMDVLLKKRYDLIPNLVATVQGVMRHERELLEQVTTLRSRVAGRDLPPADVFTTNNQLARHLAGVRLAMENYPQLKATHNMRQLQAALNEVEEQISAGRRAYNATVERLNNALEMFPTNLFGSLFRFEKAVYFEAAESERAPAPTARV